MMKSFLLHMRSCCYLALLYLFQYFTYVQNFTVCRQQAGAVLGNKVIVNLSAIQYTVQYQVLSKDVMASFTIIIILWSPVHNSALLSENGNKESDSVDQSVPQKCPECN